MSLHLYVLPLPERGQQRDESLSRENLSAAGILGEDVGNVESLSSEPGDQTIEGYYRGRYARKLADELEELADGSSGALPLYNREGPSSRAGYYAIESVDVQPVEPQTADWLEQYEIRLRNEGTDKSHSRSIESNPRENIDHEFGNNTDLLVGVPAAASGVKWFDPAAREYESADSVETREAEFGDVDLYDLEDGADELGLDVEDDDIELVYGLDYDDDGATDVRVWDERGEGEKLDDDGVLEWQKVFKTSHSFAGDCILDNGCLRLTLDEAAGTITAEEWDPDEGDDGDWVAIDDVEDAGDDTDWELYDIDVTDIGFVDVRAQLEFEHPDDGLFDLDVSLQRGFDTLLVEIPDGEDGPIPADLEDWLSPIASERVVDAQPSKGLVSRREVRR